MYTHTHTHTYINVYNKHTYMCMHICMYTYIYTRNIHISNYMNKNNAHAAYFVQYMRHTRCLINAIKIDIIKCYSINVIIINMSNTDLKT